MGAAILAKETSLLVILAALTWLALEYRGAWKNLYRALAFSFAGVVVCVSPLIFRNLAVGAPPLAVSVQSSRGAAILALGFAADGPRVGFRLLTKDDDLIAIAQRTGGQLLPTIEETLRSHGGHFWTLVERQWLRLGALVAPAEIPNNTNYAYGREISPVLKLTLGYGALFPLAVAGFLLLATRRPWLLWAYLFASMSVQLLTFTLARFRLSLVPVLILGAAFFLVQVIDAIRRRDVRRSVAYLALAATASLVQQSAALLPNPDASFRLTEYLWASRVYKSEGRFDRAVAEMALYRERARGKPGEEKGIARAAAHEGDYQLVWAAALLKEKRNQEARRHIELAARVYAESDHVAYPYNLGVMYAELGEPAKGSEFFRLFLERAPEGPRADEVRRLLAGQAQRRASVLPGKPEP
jgi:hypothetical protein